MAKKKKKKTLKLSPEEKAQRAARQRYHRDLRRLFDELGFIRVRTDGIKIVVGGREGELDDIFIYENVIVAVEYTAGKPDSSHLLKKKPLYDNILADIPGFLDIARSAYLRFASHLKGIYANEHFHVRIVYAPMYEAGPQTMGACPNVAFLQGSRQKYFCALARTIEKSARVEFFSFLGLEWNEVGEATLSGKVNRVVSRGVV